MTDRASRRDVRRTGTGIIVRVKIVSEWRLPLHDDLILPRGHSRRLYPALPLHLEVRLGMSAIERPIEERPGLDEIRSAPRGTAYNQGPYGWGNSDRLAKDASAVSAERTEEVHTDSLNTQIPDARGALMRPATAHARNPRPIYRVLTRASEWASLVA